MGICSQAEFTWYICLNEGSFCSKGLFPCIQSWLSRHLFANTENYICEITYFLWRSTTSSYISLTSIMLLCMVYLRKMCTWSNILALLLRRSYVKFVVWDARCMAGTISSVLVWKVCCCCSEFDLNWTQKGLSSFSSSLESRGFC